MNRKCLVWIVLLIGFLFACREGESPRNSLSPALAAGMAFAVAPNGETVTLEVARDEAHRSRGMMGRPEIPPRTGMLFLFGHTDLHSFWMKNCLVPLDLIWLDERGTVVHVVDSAPPCTNEPCTTYSPAQPAFAVIELGAGEAARLGFRLGARILWTEGGGGGSS